MFSEWAHKWSHMENSFEEVYCRKVIMLNPHIRNPQIRIIAYSGVSLEPNTTYEVSGL